MNVITLFMTHWYGFLSKKMGCDYFTYISIDKN